MRNNRNKFKERAIHFIKSTYSLFFKLVPVVPRFRLCRNRFPPLSLATLCLDHYTIVTIAESSYFFFLLTLFFCYRKNLKMLTTRRNRILALRLTTLWLDNYTTVTIAEAPYFFLYLIYFFRSEKKLKVPTSHTRIDPSHLDWQHSALTTTPP